MEAKLEKEQRKLLADPVSSDPNDMFYIGDPFVHHVGEFWGILETRDYMREMVSHASLTAAAAQIFDCLRLCRSDNMGMRDLLPAILLRLNRDQECYDFIKW